MFFFLVNLAGLTTPSYAQWLETTIFLPDSFSANMYIQAFAHNQTNNIIYLGGYPGDYIIAVSGADDQKIAKIPAGRCVSSLCWNSFNNKIYSANSFDNNVTVIDGATQDVITTIDVGVYPYCLAYNSINNKIYCVNSESATISVIDGATDVVINTLDIGSSWALIYDPSHNKIYCASYIESIIMVVDGAADTIINRIPVDICPIKFVIDPTHHKLYCSNAPAASVTIVDTEADTVIANVATPGEPFDMAYNSVDNKLYCASPGDFVFPESTITVIDGFNNEVIDTIFLTGGHYPPASPRGLVYNEAHNKIYCATEYHGIHVINCRTDTVRAIIEPEFFRTEPAMIYNPINNKVYCGWDLPHSVGVIDGQADTVITNIVLGVSPENLLHVAGNDKIYCSFGDAFFITAISCATNRIVATIPVAWYWYHLFINSMIRNEIYCANDYGGINVIDTDRDSIIITISLDQLSPRALAYDSNDDKIYCACVSAPGSRIVVIDANSHSIIDTIPIYPPYALAYNQIDNKVYCTTFDDNVTVINGANDSVITTIATGQRPQVMVFNSISDKIYCANMWSDNVTVIDGAADTLIATIGVGDQPSALVYNSFDNKIYCANEGNKNVSIIDGVTDMIVAQAALDSGPYSLAYDEVNNEVYCTNQGSNTVTVIDGAADTVITSIGTGKEPVALAISPAQNRIYVGNQANSSISVIRGGVGIYENKIRLHKGLSFNIFPSPARSYVSIEQTAARHGGAAGRLRNVGASIKIYDIAGKLVHTEKWDDMNVRKRISLKNLSAGVYFLKLQTGGTESIKKFVVTW